MSYNLAFFNGDVRRDRKQEAMLKSMNERDNFLDRLRDMEKKREQDEKQERATLIIQKMWKRYQARREIRKEFRLAFDKIVEQNRDRTLVEILHMSKLIVNFYESHQDEERLVMTLAELVKLRNAEKTLEEKILDTQRLLLARCCVKFLNEATENTIFFHVLRFLEDFVFGHPKLFEAVSGQGLFDAELHLFESLVGKREGTIRKAAINARHLRLLSRIFDAFVNASNQTEVSRKVADRLLKALCLSVPDDVFTNYIHPFLQDHLKPGTRNYVIFLEACTFVNFAAWKVPPKLLENVSVRLRSIFLLQIQHLNRTTEQQLKGFFDSLAILCENILFEKTGVEEDLTEAGRLRTAATLHLEVFCKSAMDSSAFCKAACTYSNLPSINLKTVISLRDHFYQLLDTLSASSVFVESLYNFVMSHWVELELESAGARAPTMSALLLFCKCLNKRVSSVADSDFVPSDLFIDFDHVVQFFRDFAIKLINLMFPNLLRSDLYSGNAAEKSQKAENEWKEVAESVFSILGAIYQKDMRIKYFPTGFWTNHGREVLSVAGQMPRRRLRTGRTQASRSVYSEFVERLAAIYEEDSDSEEEEERESGELPTSLRRAICVMKNIPFIVPFMDRVQLFQRLLDREKDKNFNSRGRGMGEVHSLSVRRDNIYMDTFEQFAPRPPGGGDRIGELKSMMRVKMVNWQGMREAGVDGGGIFREFMSELLKKAFDVNQGFFTFTENRLLYPNPTAPFLLGADCSAHFQFIGRMIGKLIYERQLQEVRFAEFFIAQLFESDKNKDIDLQHMKGFDPLIFKHLKDLLKLEEQELEDLQLDFSVVTHDMGLVRSVNLKPNGSKCRVTVDNVHEYVRLYVNHHLKLRIAPMVDPLRKGISEVISIEWMRMFAANEHQILIAGNEGAFTASEMRKHCKMVFRSEGDSSSDAEYMNMFWDVVDKLSPEDKMALLKFMTGCSRPPVDGFKSIEPRMGVLVIEASDDLPTSSTCMNMLRIPKYSSRVKLEEKLRYAINSGAGFELV